MGFLRILPVTAIGPKGILKTYALLDGGATVSLVDARIAQKTGLRGTRSAIAIRGIGNGELRGKCERIKFKLAGALNKFEVEHAIVIPRLDLPRQSLGKDITERVAAEWGIDIESYENAQIGIILGQDNWRLLNIIEIRKIKKSGLVASRTLLGWAVHGYIQEERAEKERFEVYTSNNLQKNEFIKGENERLDKLIDDYFKLENLGVLETRRKNIPSRRAEQILENTTKKIGQTWEVGLLWKSDEMPEINSKVTARKRLFSLEKKLDREPEFAALYYKEMERLFESGYAKKVEPDAKQKKTWYLPHFGVQNVNKPGKVRLVFDAAARTEGVSLNDLLEAGPNLLESLIGVLLRFRQYAYAAISDMKDMYLRINVIERDRGAQRFLYRGSDRSREPDECENLTLIFGSISSPATAIYVKNKNAKKFAGITRLALAARSIKENTYMDDFLYSGKSVLEVKQMVKDVSFINGEANFIMHGWASNEDQIVEEVRDKNKLGKEKQATLCNKEERVLGIYWDQKTDLFSFNVGLNKIRQDLMEGEVKPTKREVFSTAMSVYDPLGILSPFTMQTKILIQDIWRSGISWDSKIRDEEFEKWVRWLKNLKQIKNCKVPRCFMTPEADPLLTQLHIFCDASLQAFAAVAYLRVVQQDGTIRLSLVMAKTRVAPVKPMTVPRLELQAALLAVRMAKVIEAEMDIVVVERTFWSDSTTVLQWIRSDPRKKQMFVANRLGEIIESSRISEWRWVPSKMNPADDATRSSNEVLKGTDRWCIGPDFLKQPRETWPKQKALDKENVHQINELEKRKECVSVVCIREIQVPICVRLCGWEGLIRWIERIKRKTEKWVKRARCKVEEKEQKGKKVKEGGKEGTEVFNAAKFWYREIQYACFEKEVRALKKGESIPKGSKIIGLNLYLDREGLLRARGRTRRFKGYKFENQPIVLDACHFATQLLIAQYHRKFYHANNETIVNELRQKFYIVGLRTRLRWFAKKCIICRLRRGKPQNPPMADLPLCRLAYGLRAFTHTGLDYFGPMMVKIGRRREKRWGALFTCMTTRAVHLEIAATLTASSTIMAIQRLAARRGLPAFIYSDNGSNFTRADKELREAAETIDIDKQHEFARSRQIRWTFNPPDAPHMGGAWERLVRSVKIALKHTLKETAPAEETLWTLLVEIEHMINSRPLTHVSTDPSDEEALTPNHFLIGSSSGYLRLEKYELETINSRKQFEVVQKMANTFWKRWIREYLPTLLPR